VTPDGGVAILDASSMRVSFFAAPWREPGRALQLDLADAYNPRGLAIDSRGHFWVADTGQRRLLEYSERGVQLRALRCEECAPTFGEISDVVVAQDGTLFVADGEHERVVVLGNDGRLVRTLRLPGRGGLDGTRLAPGPDGSILAASANRAWILDDRAIEIRGNASAPVGGAALGDVGALAWDGARSLLWLGDRAARRVRSFRLHWQRTSTVAATGGK
jgi:hypothetical protein